MGALQKPQDFLSILVSMQSGVAIVALFPRGLHSLSTEAARAAVAQLAPEHSNM